MIPIVDRVKEKYKPVLRGFEIIDIRTDEGKEKIEKYGIAFIPTFLILDKSDKEIDRIVGYAEQEILEKFIEGDIKKEKR
ncbi:MAG: thioredoxin family protein [Pseudomonadota bacterium]